MGVVHGVRSAYKYLSEKGYGHIINIAPTAGLFPWSATIANTTGKHANHLPKSLSRRRLSVQIPALLNSFSTGMSHE